MTARLWLDGRRCARHRALPVHLGASVSTTRTWFVTGSSAGLGRALVSELLARGESVAATARNPAALADLCSPADDHRLWTAKLDVTNVDQIRQVVAGAVAAFGRIDVAISNAGYGLFGAAEETTDEQVERQLRTNLTGPIHLARALLPQLRAQGGGRILQISSVGGQASGPGTAIYNASKWGVEGFFESLAAEVRSFGIGVTIVEPGAVRTDFTGRSKELTEPLAAYQRTPAGSVRRSVAGGYVRYPGDLAKMAAAILDAATAPEAPLRLTLGSDSYKLIRAGLMARLADVEAQKDSAAATDAQRTAP
jgi:NAD(P)-dependent dehydrogenase (short-subunit alcohol dehydrogenase family)